MLQALIKMLLREVLATHRQWGSTDNQFGAAMNYFYSKYQSCMTTSLLKLETAKSWKKEGKSECERPETQCYIWTFTLIDSPGLFIHSQTEQWLQDSVLGGWVTITLPSPQAHGLEH